MMSCINNNENRIIDEDENEEIEEVDDAITSIKILSLGDSYTIGQSVCVKCRFPEQLRDSLQNRNSEIDFSLKVIARTGWTTKNLINAVNSENLPTDFNLITLLIGVNNQYQGLPFSIFKQEFPILIDLATTAVKSDKSKLIVLSIPDYAFTPFGNGSTKITEEVEKYNSYIKDYCKTNNISFINITDITQDGLTKPNYVANDGLHPSSEAYTKFVERILPIATQKLGF